MFCDLDPVINTHIFEQISKKEEKGEGYYLSDVWKPISKIPFLLEENILPLIIAKFLSFFICYKNKYFLYKKICWTKITHFFCCTEAAINACTVLWVEVLIVMVIQCLSRLTTYFKTPMTTSLVNSQWFSQWHYFWGHKFEPLLDQCLKTYKFILSQVGCLWYHYVSKFHFQRL